MNNGGGWPLKTDKVELWAYVNNIFTQEECKKIIFQNTELHDGLVKNKQLNQKERKSHINFIYPTTKDSYWIFERLASAVDFLNNHFFNFDLFGFIEGLQFTKYEAPGGLYKPHIDKLFNGVIRKLSITIQLSNAQDYEGGDLLLHIGGEPLIMPKEIGKLIAFPSYTLHEVTPVTKGTRYSLVAWVTGNQFK